MDGNRFQFSGQNASIVISNGTIRANSFRFGARNDSDTGNVGKTPAGIRFEGDSPRLLITNYANIPLDIGADIPVVFSIPATGYAAALPPGAMTGSGARRGRRTCGGIRCASPVRRTGS